MTPLPSIRSLVSAGRTLALVLLLASCGGGGGGSSSAGVGTGGTGYASGPVSGLASVIVNGVDFDDRSAQISDDDGHTLLRDDVQLGMTVEVDSNAISTDATGQLVATARSIQLRTLAVSVVDAVDVAGSRVQVLGQWMSVDGATVFHASFTSKLASLTAGQAITVHGLLGADGSYRITRIAPTSGTPAAYRLRAVVGAVDRGSATLSVGAVVYSTQGLSVPATIAVGSRIAATFTTSRNGSGRWVMQSLSTLTSTVADGTQMRVEGLIDRFTDSRHFSVGGTTVDATNATLNLNGGTLTLGSRVEVSGTASAGTLLASQVQADDGGGNDEIRLSGPLSGLNTTTQRFTVRQTVVDYSSSSLRVDNGTLSHLPAANASGRSVEVRGMLSSDGTRLVAQRLKFL